MLSEENATGLSRRVLQAFDNLNGFHPGFRPAHAKGILLTGTFTPNVGAASITRAIHMNQPSTPVTARFSDGGGIPAVPDNDPNASPRGFAIRFHLAPHTHTDILAHSVDGFPARTAGEFVDFLHAAAASGPDVSHPSPIELFLAGHPQALQSVQAPKPFPSSFAKECFYAVNAYRFVNQQGAGTFGRYQIRPEGDADYLSAESAAQKSPDYLFDEIRKRVGHAPVRMQISAQLAQAGDVIDDSGVHWPQDRPRIELGTVELTAIALDNQSGEGHIIFDPIPRIEGIEPSNDPLLEPRAACYLMSGRRRRANGAGQNEDMNAMRMSTCPHATGLVAGKSERPQPGPGELLIRVHAAGVTMRELSWYPSTHRRSGDERLGAVPCHEFSGVIAGAGPGIGAFEIGQEVFGMNDWFAEGALAEYCLAPVSAVAAKPSNLSHAQAASVPIAALTAWQGIYDHGHLRSGERLLVQGGSGAVGGFAVQLAHLCGAEVTATASSRHLGLVKDFGASRVINSGATRFDDGVADFDLIFDTVGGDVLDRSWTVLQPHGRMVTVASQGETATDVRVKNAFFVVEPNGKLLAEIADLLEAGHLRAMLGTTVPFACAAMVFNTNGSRRGAGKTVVEVVHD